MQGSASRNPLDDLEFLQMGLQMISVPPMDHSPFLPPPANSGATQPTAHRSHLYRTPSSPIQCLSELSRPGTKPQSVMQLFAPPHQMFTAPVYHSRSHPTAWISGETVAQGQALRIVMH
ncbi:hypothetical protein B0H11DRAFT_2228275 [Mycena galericulata]|nr:hypothetical protein B0H11DRAFT_2228275 [Mycena galericulata]